MKRALLIALVAVALLFLFLLVALGEEFTDGDYKYTLDADGNATITGYTGGDTELVIPSLLGGNPVRAIGYDAFYSDYDLKSVTLPDGLIIIGRRAFGLTGITSITFSDSLTTIGELAFSKCEALASITLPKGLTAIDGFAFSSCSSLVSITIPDGVTSIGESAFSDCTSLTSITIPDSMTAIGKRAFINCSSLTSIILPDSVTSIGPGAFASCDSLAIHISASNPTYSCIDGILFSKDLKVLLAYPTIKKDMAYEIPQGVVQISEYAFYECDSPTSITLPEGVTSIGGAAFCNCDGLVSITLPKSLISIGTYAFSSCTNLLSITIPEGVASIGEQAFSDCNNLASVTLPASVTHIGSQAFSRSSSNCVFYAVPGSYASNNVSPIASMSGFTYNMEDDRLILTGQLQTGAELVIPEALDGYPVSAIGKGAFANDGNLISVTIPASIADIREGAFLGSENLVLIVSAGSYSLQYALRNGIALAGPNDFAYRLIDGKASIAHYSGEATKLTLPKEINDYPVAHISKNAFAGNTALTSISVPNGVTDIGPGVFAGCESLKTVTLPKGLLSIDAQAFSGCTALKNIKLPADLTTLGDSAFMNCTKLTTLTLSAKVVSIGVNAFAGCEVLKLTVSKDSYALQYAKDFGIAYKIGR